MATVDEALSQASPLNADLQAGVKAIGQNQIVTFTKYVRLVLPVDGFVFWVRADLLSTSALLNAAQFNAFALNEPLSIITPASTLAVTGSLHYATDLKQSESETYAVNRVIFTALAEVRELNDLGPTELYIATFEDVKFAFSSRGKWYRQAGLYHYQGDAVYADLESQLVDSLDGFDSQHAVVSNSLPIWLALNSYDPAYPVLSPLFPSVQLYPSYLVPSNTVPPFGVVHIEPSTTQAIAGAPTFSSNFSHEQLTQERVRLTLYGLRNDQALDLVDFVTQYCLDTELMGIMNQPTVRDEKRTQVELMALSMKKTVDFQVNYLQSRVNNLARQLLLEAFVTYYPAP